MGCTKVPDVIDVILYFAVTAWAIIACIVSCLIVGGVLLAITLFLYDSFESWRRSR